MIHPIRHDIMQINSSLSIFRTGMCVHQPRALRIRSVCAAEFHATAKSMQQFIEWKWYCQLN